MNNAYGTLNEDSVDETMSIIGGTMSNGREVVEPYKEPWIKFMENEHFRSGTMKNVYGTMDNFDGSVNNAGGTLYNAYKTMCN